MMNLSVSITAGSLDADEMVSDLPVERAGAEITMRGIVRAEEEGQPIRALEYQAYRPMAEKEIRRLAEEVQQRFPCLAVTVRHRIGIIPAGETAILVRVLASHRAEALAYVGVFMDRLKQDVPIWKVRAIA
jgi:molybdopterin synthase catalytic subunit